jgi:protein SCO1
MASLRGSGLKWINVNLRTIHLFILPMVLLSTVFFAACHRAQMPTVKRYPFTGRVISTNAQGQSAIIDGDNIPGFMDAMAMEYKVKPPSMLGQLATGDSISAEIVAVQAEPKNPDAAPDYWLENVKIIGHAKASPTALTNVPHIPVAGETVPDFSFTDQDGKRISIGKYRGKVLLVTFIYTRCPFPDFCPRMSRNFAEIYRQIETTPALSDTHLLSVSFDPEHDTPKILREYGFSVAHTRNRAVFKQWEFAVPHPEDLPKIAGFFALTVTPENGLITHNLSTAVIGPDGKVVSWYHGGDWQVSDLIKDAESAAAHKS